MGWVINGSPELDGESRWRTVVGVSIAMTVLMVIIVGLRAYTRICVIGRLGSDDWATFFSTGMGIAYAVCCIVQTRYGLALLPALRPPEDLHTYTKWNYAGRVFYYCGVAGFKIALCIIYLRMTRGIQLKLYCKVIWGTLALVVSSHVVTALVILLSCSPAVKNVKPWVPGKCFHIGPLYYGTSVTSIVCDLILFFLPLPLVLRLQMSSWRKYGLACTFLLGLFTTFCSFFRLAQIPAVIHPDDATGLIMWGVLEIDVGVITTTLVTLAPLFSSLKNWSSRSSAEYPPGRSNKSNKTSGSGNGIQLNYFGRTRRDTEIEQAPVFSGRDSSQERILSVHRVGGDTEAQSLEQKITKQTEIQIHSTPRGDILDTTLSDYGIAASQT